MCLGLGRSPVGVGCVKPPRHRNLVRPGELDCRFSVFPAYALRKRKLLGCSAGGTHSL